MDGGMCTLQSQYLLSYKFPLSSKLWQEHALVNFPLLPSHRSHPPNPESAIFEWSSSSSSSFSAPFSHAKPWESSSPRQQWQGLSPDSSFDFSGVLVAIAPPVTRTCCFVCAFLLLSSALRFRHFSMSPGTPIFSVSFCISKRISSSRRWRPIKWWRRAAPSIRSRAFSNLSLNFWRESLSWRAVSLSGSKLTAASCRSLPLAKCFWNSIG